MLNIAVYNDLQLAKMKKKKKKKKIHKIQREEAVGLKKFLLYFKITIFVNM